MPTDSFFQLNQLFKNSKTDQEQCFLYRLKKQVFKIEPCSRDLWNVFDKLRFLITVENKRVLTYNQFTYNTYA